MMLPDYLRSGLIVVFVGYNPGSRSAVSGHHYAGPGNTFWRLLHDAGLTPRCFHPKEDFRLLDYSIGLTNIVARTSPGSSDLTLEELRTGGMMLRRKLSYYCPKLVACLGKDVFRHYAGLSTSIKLTWGWQQDVEAMAAYLAPNPSARSTIAYEERLRCFQEIAAWYHLHS